jgi:preprotein translocase subunit SecE
VARNRKRARDARRTQPVAARPGDARSGRAKDTRPGRPADASVPESNGTPSPLSHATPDSELVEAQLAAGRGDPIDDLQTAEEERELEALATGGSGAVGPVSGRASGAGGRDESTELDVAPAATPARKVSAVSRLRTFLRGSWAELQRVQWPDRRQVMQATGVVVGFVIIAGAFLGGADWAAGKIMDFILK